MLSTYEIATADNLMDALVYGETHPNTINYLRNQFNQFSNTLQDSARSFLAQGRELVDRFYSSEAMRFARNAVQNLFQEHAVQTEYILPITELNAFQQASLTMQRWLMANPTARQLYHQQRIDGYSDTYRDMEPGLIGHEHYDYRRVMDGLMQFHEDDWEIVQYLDQLKEGDRELLLEEKLDIKETSWTWLEAMLAIGKDDATSRFGDMM